MQKFYITFGQGHMHKRGPKFFDHDCVCIIKASNENIAREIAFEAFNDKWCWIHDNIDDVKMEYYPRGLIEL